MTIGRRCVTVPFGHPSPEQRGHAGTDQPLMLAVTLWCRCDRKVTQILSDDKEWHCYRAWIPHITALTKKKPQVCYPNVLGTLGISNLKRDLVPPNCWIPSQHGHQGFCASFCSVFTPCSQPSDRHQGQLRCQTRHHPSHHESINTEPTEAFICCLEIF